MNYIKLDYEDFSIIVEECTHAGILYHDNTTDHVRIARQKDSENFKEFSGRIYVESADPEDDNSDLDETICFIPKNQTKWSFLMDVENTIFKELDLD